MKGTTQYSVRWFGRWYIVSKSTYEMHVRVHNWIMGL